ncbi:uncharacterized protein LOC118193573 [Stegodyphus dumicola]|uniref:uncharacterized protein LOC118193573 n=1 Tax=Stegodyphus dumicola TaxID=202533 RepID=UPI0015B05251|nr:uncharacterized protein LOC118193573 [Stegodyphus dumicola]
MAVAQEVNDDSNYRIGSPIYIYNSKAENRLVLREVLSTYGPQKVLHFYVAGNRYIIFIGRDDAIIFWWTNDQFLQWQTIPETAGASDVYILSLPNGEVAIVITRMEEVLFLTLDSSGHYFVSWVLQFPETTLSSLHVMFSGKAYYALVRFATTTKYYPSVWRLTLDTFHMPTGSSLDALQECLKSVNEILVERQTELDVVSKDLDRIWTKGANQNISTSVIVKGK